MAKKKNRNCNNEHDGEADDNNNNNNNNVNNNNNKEDDSFDEVERGGTLDNPASLIPIGYDDDDDDNAEEDDETRASSSISSLPKSPPDSVPWERRHARYVGGHDENSMLCVPISFAKTFAVRGDRGFPSCRTSRS